MQRQNRKIEAFVNHISTANLSQEEIKKLENDRTKIRNKMDTLKEHNEEEIQSFKSLIHQIDEDIMQIDDQSSREYRKLEKEDRKLRSDFQEYKNKFELDLYTLEEEYNKISKKLLDNGVGEETPKEAPKKVIKDVGPIRENPNSLSRKNPNVTNKLQDIIDILEGLNDQELTAFINTIDDSTAHTFAMLADKALLGIMTAE